MIAAGNGLLPNWPVAEGELAVAVLRQAFAADMLWLSDGQLCTFARSLDVTPEQLALLERLEAEAEQL